MMVLKILLQQLDVGNSQYVMACKTITELIFGHIRLLNQDVE